MRKQDDVGLCPDVEGPVEDVDDATDEWSHVDQCEGDEKLIEEGFAEGRFREDQHEQEVVDQAAWVDVQLKYYLATVLSLCWLLVGRYGSPRHRRSYLSRTEFESK